MQGQSTHLIYNKRVKLFATWLNNMGVGAVIAGVITPIVAGYRGISHSLAWS